jgi:hypothetical protein
VETPPLQPHLMINHLFVRFLQVLPSQSPTYRVESTPELLAAYRWYHSLSHRTRTPSFSSQCKGLVAFCKGDSGILPEDTPYFQLGGQMAM